MPLHGPTILVADDEQMVLKFVSLVLERAGFTVHTVTSGAAALEMAANFPEPPDLVILDLVMPEMDGVQLSDRLKDIYPNLRILFMSGYNQEEIDLRCGSRPELSGLLKKPFTSSELLSRVRQVIARPLCFNA
jgi:CheY-like chemotaxis protein